MAAEQIGKPNQTPLLSTMMQEASGFLLKEALNAASSHAMVLQQQTEQLSAEDKIWMLDYLENIKNALISLYEDLDVTNREVNRSERRNEVFEFNSPSAALTETPSEKNTFAKKVAGGRPEQPPPAPPTIFGPSTSKMQHHSSHYATPAPKLAPPPPPRVAERSNLPRRLNWTMGDSNDINWRQAGMAEESWGGRPARQHELVFVQKPDKYDGRRAEARRWLENYEAAAIVNGWSDEMCLKYFPAFLTQSAADWFAAIARPKLPQEAKWLHLRDLFVKYFVGPEEREAIREELMRAWQRRDEPTVDFISRMMRLLIVADPHHSERERVTIIKLKLRDNLRDALVSHRPTSLEELNDLCYEIECNLEAKIKRNERRKANEAKIAPRSSRNNSNENINKQNNANNKQTNNETKKNITYHCKFCNKDGHSEERCWAKNGKPSKTAAALEASDEEEEQEDNSNATIARGAPKVIITRNSPDFCSVVAMASDKPSFIAHKIKLNQVSYEAMMDTGSNLSIIRAEVAEALGVKPRREQIELVNANGDPINCLGKVKLTLTMTIGQTNKEVSTEFVVAKDLCVPVLIGCEIMGWLKVLVRPYNKTIIYEDEPTGARLTHQTTLPPRSQLIVAASVPSAIMEGSVMIIMPTSFEKTLMVANSISRVDSHHGIRCLLANLEPKEVIIEAGTQLGQIELLGPTETDVTDKEVVAATTQLEGDDYTNVGDELNSEQIAELKALLSSHKKAFSIGGELGRTDLIKHEIELLEGAKPIVEPLRRRPLADKLEAKRQVEKMLKDNIIEISKSPWASAYVLVKKKDGEMRLCIDFRRLNDFTKKQVFPLPNIEECLEPLSGNRYFSTLDLASGYWQIEMAEESRELTSFRTDDAQYHFLRMPFGLCNAPASFQRLVNALFAGMKGVHLQVFIDDICVASKTWREHLGLLHQVFELLEQANLKLKPKKCVFGAQQVLFLGHVLSEEGIRQDPKKLSAISGLPAPKNAEEVMRVLGLFNYYRRFVPNFSGIEEPIRRLTRKNVPFVWDKEQEKAFQDLKEALMKNPTLIPFSQSAPTVLKTDASRVGLAAILLQQQQDDWHIVTCISRRVSEAESHYSITELEGTAMVWAIDKLRNYLLGKPFTVLTDHCALCVLRKRSPKSAKLRRWQLILADYDYSIMYVKGELHADVDCLSRAPVEEEIDAYLDNKVTSIVTRKADSVPERCALSLPLDEREWKNLTAEDDEAKPLLEQARRRKKGFKIINGSLYYERRLYVPQAKRSEIISTGHSDPPICHGGVRATLEHMATLWWPNMANDIRQFIESCEVCQRRKSERRTPRGEAFSFHAYEPMQLVAIDALGPLPPSLTGTIHVIVACCCFTRFVYAEAVKDLKGKTAAMVVSRFIGQFGVPQTLISDNSATFKNEDMRMLAAKLHFVLRYATPHHHQGNSPVERVIGALQEKLSLITHDPVATTDWDEALPSAVLSLNNSLHTSTKFTPHELMFGRRPAWQSEMTHDEGSEIETWWSLRTIREQFTRAEAIANQADAQAYAAARYNNHHQQKQFDIGDMVLCRVMGRRAKLNNRWEGPYIVKARTNDIYAVESVGSNRLEKLERHVSDIRPYKLRSDRQDEGASNSDDSESDGVDEQRGQTQSQSSSHSQPDNNPSLEHLSNIEPDIEPQSQMNKTTLLLLVLIINPAAATITFKEAPLVSWLPTHTYVSPAPTDFNLVIRWGSPCAVLSQFRITPGQMDDTRNAVDQCNRVFHQQITAPLAAIAKAQAALPQLVSQDVSENRIQGAIRQSNMPGQYQSSTNIGGPRRDKRGLGDFVFGAFASNVITTIADRIFPNPAVVELQSREGHLEENLALLNANLTFSGLQIKAMAESAALSAKLVEHNVHRIDAVTTVYPQLTVVTADMVARLHLLGAAIERMRVSFKMKKPDVGVLYSLFHFEPILEIDEASIFDETVRLSSPDHNTLRVEFKARRKSRDTKVYAVSSFRYWADLLEEKAKLFEYTGPRYVIYNSTANCVKGISQAPASYVTAMCLDNNSIDNRLRSWKEVASGKNHHEMPHQTEVIDAYPYTFISCYGENITIVTTNETAECPSHAFYWHWKIKWSTPTYEYSPSAIELNLDEDMRPIIIESHPAHEMPKGMGMINTNRAIKRVRDLLQQVEVLRNQSIAVQVGEYPISYNHSSTGLLALCGLLAVTVGYLIYIRYKLNAEKLRMLEFLQRELNKKGINDHRAKLNSIYAAITHQNQRNSSLPMIEWHNR